MEIVFFGQKFWRAMTSEWEIVTKFWSRNQNRTQSQGLPYVKALFKAGLRRPIEAQKTHNVHGFVIGVPLLCYNSRTMTS